jgi:SAM-dependent methyltransferase
MRHQIAETLRDLNRSFYDAFGQSFDASRGPTEPGLKRILPSIAPESRVLDLGCGQARLASLLPFGCKYVGVDNSETMLSLAQMHINHRDLGLISKFIALDLLNASWTTSIPGAFDWIIMRAVLHHIPGYDNRRSLLQQTSSLLDSRGRILVANWQFLEISRLRRRVLPWSDIDLAPWQVEPGDYLLDWRRDGYSRRYVHLINETETLALANESGLNVVDMFRSDGHTDDLTLYAVLSKNVNS